MAMMTGQLYEFDQVPSSFQELFIVSGYRNPRSSPLQCVLSIFEATNETLNFWTHFLPFLYFLWCVYKLSGELDFGQDVFVLPMLMYMFSICLYPFLSAFAHVFNAMSKEARHFCFFLDYAALSWYSIGAAIAYKAYVFPKVLMNSTFANLYLPIAVLNAIGCMTMACESRFLKQGFRKKAFRFTAFAVPYLYDSLPLLYRVLFCSPAECTASSLSLHVRQFFFASFAGFWYTSHLPERLYPGYFDTVGHSHQLFHVFSVLGTRDQMSALLLDIKEKREDLLEAGIVPGFYTCVGLMAGIALLNVLILRYYAHKLYHVPSDDMQAPVVIQKPSAAGGDDLSNGYPAQIGNDPHTNGVCENQAVINNHANGKKEL